MSPGRRPPSAAGLVSAAVKWRLVVLTVGLVGALVMAWSMSNVSTSAQAAGRLGLRRIQSNMDDILAILALPMLLFFVILVAWSVFDLIRLHRAANDPANYRRGRVRRRS